MSDLEALKTLAGELEREATKLRDEAVSIRHHQYYPLTQKEMREIADRVDKLAIRLRRIAA